MERGKYDILFRARTLLRNADAPVAHRYERGGV